jgi:hypothetical protein
MLSRISGLQTSRTNNYKITNNAYIISGAPSRSGWLTHEFYCFLYENLVWHEQPVVCSLLSWASSLTITCKSRNKFAFIMQLQCQTSRNNPQTWKSYFKPYIKPVWTDKDPINVDRNFVLPCLTFQTHSRFNLQDNLSVSFTISNILFIFQWPDNLRHLHSNCKLRI